MSIAIGGGRPIAAAEGTAVEQAESTRSKRRVFTNRGKANGKETNARQGKRITRVPFTVSRLMEFCTQRELVNQTGHDYPEWPLVCSRSRSITRSTPARRRRLPP
jgi:hypothetical protein